MTNSPDGRSRIVRWLREFVSSSAQMALVLLVTDVFSWGISNESPRERLVFVLVFGIGMAMWHEFVWPRVVGMPTR